MNLRTNRNIRRASAWGVAASALIALSVATTSAAQASTVVAENGAGACVVADGTLTWGVKESFRAYISGSFANGEWQTADGAEYETPSFIWTGGTGEIDPATGKGSVSFTGSVTFTGHGGVLNLNLANPTVEFEDGEGVLLMDSKSNDMEGNLATDAKQQWVGAIKPTSIEVQNGKVELTELPMTLTNEGAEAFAGFYEAGVDLDPISLSLQLDGCADSGDAPVVTDDENLAVDEPEAIAETEQNVPWLPIIIGGVAVLVIGVTVGMLVAGRKPKNSTQASSGSEERSGSDDANQFFGEN